MQLKEMALRTHGVIALVAGEPARGHTGWLVQAARRALSAAFVLACAGAATTGVAGGTRMLVDEKAIKKAVDGMIAPSRNSSHPAAQIIEKELGARLHLAVHESPDFPGIAVLVGLGEAPETPKSDPCGGTGHVSPSAICLVRVKRLLSLDSFVSVEIPGTAYAIPQLVLETAKIKDPDLEFSTKKSARVTRAVEQLIGEALFVPDGSGIGWGRRLNGPIQFTIYFLGSAALVLIVLGWANSVAQNGAVRAVQRIELDPDRGDGARNSATTAAHDSVEEGGDTSAATLVEQRARPTPWNKKFINECGLDLSDAQGTAKHYEKVCDAIGAKSEVLGVRVEPPALRLRRAGARAVANTGDTSILPLFLDAQKDAILAYYDARLSLVRYLLWTLPTVGFIGTILGISAALGATIGLQSTRELVATLAQAQVSAAMGIAFDTTLVGLISTALVMLVHHAAQGGEERMTVLERDAAEKEIMEVSRWVRKPGGPTDLAQQLISLGIHTEHLVKDLRLFQSTGPELAGVIAALKERQRELDTVALTGRTGTESNRKPSALRLVIIVALAGGVVAAAGVVLSGKGNDWTERIVGKARDFVEQVYK